MATMRQANRRVAQADQTRAEILQAARRRFASAGYAATTVKDIANEAGVSVQTVYDSVGSKAELVRRLNDRIDEEVGVASIAVGLGRTDDPEELLGIQATITARMVERCGDILRVVLAGQDAAPELVQVAREGGRRHRAGCAAVAGRLADLGALRDGLTAADAAVTIAVLGDFRLALSLVDDHGFDAQAVQGWIAGATALAVLRRD